MKRERLLTQLIHLRELHLKNQAAQLKARAQHLKEVRARHDETRAAAAESLEDPGSLADLVHIGHARVYHARLTVKVETEVRALSAKVGNARKLAESAREAHAELRRRRMLEVERAMETEAEHFFSWKKDQQR